MSVCLSVCPLASPENRVAELHQIFMHDIYGHGSVLLWQRCDTLCTAGFVDGVMFSHYGPKRQYDKHNGRDSNQILLNDKDQK